MAINVVTFSSSGGAGNVARTLVDGFLKIGLEANLFSATRSNLRASPLERPPLTVSAALDEFVLKSRTFEGLISVSRDGHSAIGASLPVGDLNIFRWMNGLLGSRFVRQNPDIENLVWGLDDMNPFTGACHYSGDCRGFESNCSSCPAVRPPFRGLIEKNLNRKLGFADTYKPKYVAPTQWINGEFQKSSFSKHGNAKVILNPLQSRFFEGATIAGTCSKMLKLLIVAVNLDDPIKGVWDVKDVLNRFLEQGNSELTLVGRYSKKLAESIPNARFVGSLDSKSVREKLREHDLLLVPSFNENAGTIVAEAASQGVPSLAREVGGMPEMTNYGKTGYLFVSNWEIYEILNSITLLDLKSVGLMAQEWAQQLKPELIATKYAEEFL